jgi:hypothetical protein
VAEPATRVTHMLPDPWVPPWKPGLRQERCTGVVHSDGTLHGTLCVAVTLDKTGLCAACRTRGVDDRPHFKVPDPEPAPAPQEPVQQVLC